MSAPKPVKVVASNIVEFKSWQPPARTSSADFSILTDELKHLEHEPGEYWYLLGGRLLLILKQRLYRSGGYHSFADYCTRGLGYSRQHIYKLMQVVQFIDRHWQAAQNQAERAKVARLFALGFTKLYLLHTLPDDRLEHLLTNGISVPVNNFYPERRITIEQATVAQLHRELLRTSTAISTTENNTWTHEDKKY